MSLSTTFTYLLNTSRAGDLSTSQGSAFHPFGEELFSNKLFPLNFLLGTGCLIRVRGKLNSPTLFMWSITCVWSTTYSQSTTSSPLTCSLSVLWRRKGQFNLPQLWGKAYSHLLSPVSCTDTSSVPEAQPEESSCSVPCVPMLLEMKKRSMTLRLFEKGCNSLSGFLAV